MNFNIMSIVMGITFVFCGLMANLAHAQDTKNGPPPLVKIIKKVHPPSLRLPVDCTPGADCWVVNYPDRGPANDGKAVDPGCLSRTYETHSGTDFSLENIAAMEKNVAVRAAADGTVSRLRDGEADRIATAEDQEAVKAAKKECGNAVLIDHADGWQTLYCHLKKDSVAVRVGQSVRAGDRLGAIGLSGLTEFPHLHFGVTHKGKVMDPFTGRTAEEDCAAAGKKLWEEKSGLGYEPLLFQSLGFTTAAPTLESLQAEPPESPVGSSAALVFYTVILGAREGDTASLTITDPAGNIFATTKKTQDKNRARQLYFIGRKTSESPLKPGEYKGVVKVTRTDKDGGSQSFHKIEMLLLN